MLTLDLPLPPTVNRVWGYGTLTGGVYTTKKYRKWQEYCNALCLQFRWHKTPVKGPFQIWVTLDRAQRVGDLDNRLKGILDFLHRAGITDDDSLCERIVAEWGDAPVGCRVLVAEWSEAETGHGQARGAA